MDTEDTMDIPIDMDMDIGDERKGVLNLMLNQLLILMQNQTLILTTDAMDT